MGREEGEIQREWLGRAKSRSAVGAVDEDGGSRLRRERAYAI